MNQRRFPHQRRQVLEGVYQLERTCSFAWSIWGPWRESRRVWQGLALFGNFINWGPLNWTDDDGRWKNDFRVKAGNLRRIKPEAHQLWFFFLLWMICDCKLALGEEQSLVNLAWQSVQPPCLLEILKVQMIRHHLIRIVGTLITHSFGTSSVAKSSQFLVS